MKRFTFAIMVTSALLMVGNTVARTSPVADAKTQKAVVVFDAKVKLMNVILKGQYLFVHDEERMARGEACTYIYNYADRRQGDLVTSFHCIPVERKKTDQFSATLKMLPGMDMYELVEYQLAGETEGHRVP
jgi:hypothetical protein